jgi:hypothetical protein
MDPDQAQHRHYQVSMHARLQKTTAQNAVTARACCNRTTPLPACWLDRRGITCFDAQDMNGNKVQSSCMCISAHAQSQRAACEGTSQRPNCVLHAAVCHITTLLGLLAEDSSWQGLGNTTCVRPSCLPACSAHVHAVLCSGGCCCDSAGATSNSHLFAHMHQDLYRSGSKLLLNRAHTGLALYMQQANTGGSAGSTCQPPTIAAASTVQLAVGA